MTLTSLVPLREVSHRKQEPIGLVAPAALAALRLGSARPASMEVPRLNGWCRCSGVSLHAAERLSWLQSASQLAVGRQLPPGSLLSGSARPDSVPQQVPRLNGWCRCSGVSLHAAERPSWPRSAIQLAVGRSLPSGWQPRGLVAMTAPAALRLSSGRLDSARLGLARSDSALSGSARLGSAPQQAPRLIAWCRCAGVSLHAAGRQIRLWPACWLPSGRQLAQQAHALQPLLRLPWPPERALAPLRPPSLLPLGLGLALALTAPALQCLHRLQQAPGLELGQSLQALVPERAVPMTALLPAPEQGLQRSLWTQSVWALVLERTVSLTLSLLEPEQAPWELPLLHQCVHWLALGMAQSAYSLPLWLRQLQGHSHPRYDVSRPSTSIYKE